MQPDAADAAWFAALLATLESAYLEAPTAEGQSGSSRTAEEWDRYRRPIAAAIDRDGTLLDVGCANGLLMERLPGWCGGLRLEPYGLDLSDKLAALARRRLPHWHERIFVGNALYWQPPRRFDFVRTELVYVPPRRRRAYAERLLRDVVAPGGRLILCSYGSARPDGIRTESLRSEVESWGFVVTGEANALGPDGALIVTCVVWIDAT